MLKEQHNTRHCLIIIIQLDLIANFRSRNPCSTQRVNMVTKSNCSNIKLSECWSTFKSPSTSPSFLSHFFGSDPAPTQMYKYRNGKDFKKPQFQSRLWQRNYILSAMAVPLDGRLQQQERQWQGQPQDQESHCLETHQGTGSGRFCCHSRRVECVSWKKVNFWSPKKTIRNIHNMNTWSCDREGWGSADDPDTELGCPEEARKAGQLLGSAGGGADNTDPDPGCWEARLSSAVLRADDPCPEPGCWGDMCLRAVLALTTLSSGVSGGAPGFPATLVPPLDLPNRGEETRPGTLELTILEARELPPQVGRLPLVGFWPRVTTYRGSNRSTSVTTITAARPSTPPNSLNTGREPFSTSQRMRV